MKIKHDVKKFYENNRRKINIAVNSGLAGGAVVAYVAHKVIEGREPHKALPYIDDEGNTFLDIMFKNGKTTRFFWDINIKKKE